MGMKKTSLQKAFWKFLLWLMTGLGAAAAVPFCILLLLANLGVLTFANNCEQQTKALVPILAASPDISDIRLPVGTKYLQLDKSYEFISTNMTEKEKEQAMTFAVTGQMLPGGGTQLVLVSRAEEYIILQYYIGSQFINPWLQEHLPSPEILLIGIMVLNCLVVCIFLTAYFAKMLGRELLPLFQATKEIEGQNLDFEMGHSKITEFENVLLSFDNMRNSLKDSLEQQWRSEQAQREQIASLAHDLKTPLTVIQGNIDLLNETGLDDEQRLYVHYAVESSEKMKEYIKILIDISRASTGYRLQKEPIDFLSFWEHVLTQTRAVCRDKRIKLEECHRELPQVIIADRLLLERAIMNIIINAVEYTPENTVVYLEASRTEECLEIRIRDCGCGFSEEALRHAKERFYMNDQSRGLGLHFGMGLYIADTIVRQHKGKLVLGNSEKNGGAEVITHIPIGG